MMKHSWMLWMVAIASVPALDAQFSSGSTGSDGALSYTTPGTYLFNPEALGLDPVGDNIFNFTTINIAAGVTLQLTADLVRNKSVIFLASGNVTIAGALNLNGANGAADSATDPGAGRYPAMPGPGGFPGGVGAYLSSPATNGGGWGGGATTSSTGGGGVYNYFTEQLVPLIGGTGGAGGQIANGSVGGNGGAGGGAIRIVSSTSISVSGDINAAGGAATCGLGGYCGGRGSGGAIHLIAPTVTVSGALYASVNDCSNCDLGVIKVSGTTVSVTTYQGNLYTGPLYNPPLPIGASEVEVVSVNGIPAPANVVAGIQSPDFTVSTTSAVSINIAAQYVPVGTVVKLYVTSEQGNDQVISCAALAGTLASSTATCAGATFPQGVSIAYIRAVW
jgi:hypothetical protein